MSGPSDATLSYPNFNFPEFRDIFNDWNWPSPATDGLKQRRPALAVQVLNAPSHADYDDLISPLDTRQDTNHVVTIEQGLSFLSFDSFTSVDLVSSPESDSTTDTNHAYHPYSSLLSTAPLYNANRPQPSSAFSSPSASTCSLRSTFEGAFGDVSNLPRASTSPILNFDSSRPSSPAPRPTSPRSPKPRRGILPSKFDPPTPVVGAFEPVELSPRRTTSTLVSSAKKVMTRKLGFRRSKEATR